MSVRDRRRFRPVFGAILAWLAAVGAASAGDPPPFLGAAGQFTLIAPPRKAPLGPVTDEKGGTVDLARLRGKVIVLNFWATWCAPCILEMPTLDKLKGDLAGTDVEVLVVSVDLKGMEKVGPFWRERGFKHLAILLDQRSALYRAFGTRGLPTTYLIDKSGTIVGYLEGHADWASKEAKALIDYYRQKPSP